ncbi:MAG: SIS domain-containing protein [Nanoarchaeota archaeon]
MRQTITKILKESAAVKLATAERLSPEIEEAAKRIIVAFRAGGKLVLFGNGGSAADAQHIATELVHQFEKKRPALHAMVLHGNTSAMTSIGNDWGFDEVYARQIEGIATKKDVVIAISTSGNSANIIRGIEEAKRKGSYVIGFSNQDGGKMKGLLDLAILVPATNTARVQECHITIGHILCKLIEDELFPEAGGKIAP